MNQDLTFCQVTINSNLAPRNEAEERLLWRIMERTAGQLWSDAEISRMVKFVVTRNGQVDRTFEGDTFEENVKGIKAKAAVETGRRQNLAVHLHTILTIKHNSRIHLDRNVILRRFVDIWNQFADDAHQIRSAYINIAAGSDNINNLIQYQDKDLDVNAV